MNLRLRVILLIFYLSFLIVVARLYYWQIYKRKELSVQARNQYTDTSVLKAKRGEILANDESWLVANGIAWRLYVSIPDLEIRPEILAEKIAPLLVEDKEDKKKLSTEIDKIKNLLGKKNLVWVPIKERIDQSTKDKIESLKIKGIEFETQDIRVYPEASSAAHLLGFVGKDKEGKDKGYFGLEGYYDLVLSGKPGYLEGESDASGTPLVFEKMKKVSAIEGVTLITSINKTIQLILEKNLLKGIEKYSAKAGSVIVMDPRDGGILGMSSYPSFEPFKYYLYGDSYFLNPVVSSSFEPGSIFKIVVMAAALDAQVVRPDTKCDICTGPFRVGNYSIRTWNNVYHPDSSMVDVIVNSDNVGMSFVGKKLGIDKLYDYLNLFGFGNKTGIDLQGEFSPKLREKFDWSEIDLATASFGQGVAVTPIQMIRAVAAIANDGILVKPHVVEKIVSKDWDSEVYSGDKKAVISKKAADEVTAMMVEAARLI